MNGFGQWRAATALMGVLMVVACGSSDQASDIDAAADTPDDTPGNRILLEGIEMLPDDIVMLAWSIDQNDDPMLIDNVTLNAED